MKNIAIIDLGTNTFNLLISDTARKKLYNEKIAVKLGKGGISKGLITAEAMERALDTLVRYKAKADEYKVSAIYAIATSAVRSAENGQEFVTRTFEKTGIEIQVIDGDAEAEFIYHGVRAAMDLDLRKSLIVDIGGGSVEFIIADKHQIHWKRSLEIGAQRLLDKFHIFDPIEKDEILNLADFIETHLEAVTSAVNEHRPEILVGSSGTFDTLAEMIIIEKKEQTDYSRLTEYTLETEEFRFLYEQIISRNRTERMAIPGMIEMRVDMIVVACCLIKFIVGKYNLEKIRVSSYSLKEGVLEKAIRSLI